MHQLNIQYSSQCPCYTSMIFKYFQAVDSVHARVTALAKGQRVVLPQREHPGMLHISITVVQQMTIGSAKFPTPAALFAFFLLFRTCGIFNKC